MRISVSRLAGFIFKLARGTRELYETGKGSMYIGFHLDPLYRVHWNNEAPALEYEITMSSGASVSPASGMGAHPEEKADADPREFILEVDAEPGQIMQLDVKYYACDDAQTFCVPVKQKYELTLARDVNHGWSIRTGADGSLDMQRPRR